MNKKLFKGALVLFASILMAVSCSSNSKPEDDNKNNNNNNNNTIVKPDLPAVTTEPATTSSKYHDTQIPDAQETARDVAITYKVNDKAISGAKYYLESATKESGGTGDSSITIAKSDFTVSETDGKVTLSGAKSKAIANTASNTAVVKVKVRVKITSTDYKDGFVDLYLSFSDKHN